MEDSTCHEMVTDLLKLFKCIKCCFLHLFISSDNNFHVDAERKALVEGNIFICSCRIWISSGHRFRPDAIPHLHQ